MPELPEVETIARKLKKLLPGKKIKSTVPLHAKSFGGDVEKVTGAEITDVTRRAKIIRIHLNNGLNLLVHLKMTGQLIYLDSQFKVGGGHPTADWVNQLPGQHTRVFFDLEPDAKLFFNDQRIFGWIRLVTNEQVAEVFAAYGPDAHDSEFTTDYFSPLLQRKRIPIKVALMDNSLVSGVGNIYAAEALNLAKISPFKPAQSLSHMEVERVVAATQEVINKGIELGGTTFDGKYVDAEGLAGSYQKVMRVYGRQGKPCLNCGQVIIKTTIAGRGTYYCPNCQD